MNGEGLMFSTMEECTNFIFKLRASEYKGEPLQSARILLKALGNPEKQSKFIHIAGSNGKGSTLNATREILMNHELTVGAFISPHLERPNERVTINKEQITDDQFLKYANKIAHVVQTELDGKFPSFFEFMTLIGFLHFANEKVDVVVLETGIGGRLDSTNVITPEVSVITTVSLEHIAMLGDTYALVASEKAGIIKHGKPVVVGVKNEEALEVIKCVAASKEAPIYVLNETIHVQKAEIGDFTYEGIGRIENIELAMIGAHQYENATLAITACSLFLGQLHEEAVRKALKEAVWEGRFEEISEQVILDGAHNSEGTAALIQALKQTYPNEKYRFIYAAMADKDHIVSIRLMDSVAETISFTALPLPTAMDSDKLCELSNHPSKRSKQNWQQLVREELDDLKKDELLVITGSLYFIGEVRKWIKMEG
jgi:dihydrofolate synthase / folylpolyglutamate synthase